MKYCSKCGKALDDAAVVCIGCGCMVPPKEGTYEDAIASSAICCIISGCLLALGVFVALFVSVLFGVILCLGAEIAAVIPNTKVQTLFNKNNAGITDKNQRKAKKQALKRQLEEMDNAYRISFILAIVAFVFVVVFTILM